MRILQIHTGLSLMGGAESLIINLANEQVKINKVKVCSIFKPLEDSIFYTRLSEEVEKEHLGIVANGFSLKNLWKIFTYIRSTDAQIVHIHGFFYYYVLPIVLLKNRLKFVYTVHSDAYMENSRWDKRILWLKRFCFKKGWLNAVTISAESKTSFEKLYGLDSRLIKNGVPRPKIFDTHNIIDELRITLRTKVFFHPGRISSEKNQVTLCKVFSRLIEEGEDVALAIAGTNQDEFVFEQMKPYFCERIRYLGERNDVPQLLSRADGFCLPSNWEGLPITLLESLSVGCIPICSPVGGIVNVIESGINGLLSKSSSEDDYYQCMRSFLSLDYTTIAVMKRKAIESFTPYNISFTAKGYYDFYRELICI